MAPVQVSLSAIPDVGVATGPRAGADAKHQMPTDTSPAQYGIITLLPPDAAAYHQALYAAVEERFGLTGRVPSPWPPHVTLKYHFSPDDMAAVEAVLMEFARTEPPVPWAIDGFNSFKDGDVRVIFMEPRPNAAVRAAHARLLERLRAFDWMPWRQYDGPDMDYHATIAHRGLTPQNFDDVWSFVTNHEPPRFDLSLDNVALVEIAGDGEMATVRRRFDLTGAAA